jgi:hypothetical protein
MDFGQSVSTSVRLPAYAQLKHVTGVLQPPYLHTCHRCKVKAWGRLTEDNGSEFDFMCDPWEPAYSCAYSVYVHPDPNVGKRFDIAYFDAPGQVGPPHIIMEMRGIGAFKDAVLLGYSQSIDRIEGARSEAYENQGLRVLAMIAIIVLFVGMIFFNTSNSSSKRSKLVLP